MLNRPLVTYLIYALTMTTHLPAGDPVRGRAERALLRRLEAELVRERRESSAAVTSIAVAES